MFFESDKKAFHKSVRIQSTPERKKEASKDESRAHAAREEEFAEHSSVDGNAGGCISDGSGIDAWIHATHHRRGYQV